ncbi:MAG: hypothetical protein V7K38_00985 [Nostoc sp.]|uniref:hypothetical protein n=1 Tax=Nostoc sp. TaxID=1180 RepID=UPI002FF44E29
MEKLKAPNIIVLRSYKILVCFEAGVIPIETASAMSFAALETMDYTLITLIAIAFD